jgi:hypothetical protein
MKHISYADKSLLAGDDVVDLLLHYAARLADSGSADDVDVHVYSSDGDETTATFVLGPGMGIMAEVAHTSMEAPDNSETIAYLREKLELLDSGGHGARRLLLRAARDGPARRPRGLTPTGGPGPPRPECTGSPALSAARIIDGDA